MTTPTAVQTPLPPQITGTPPAAGIYPTTSFEEYHGWAGVSNSRLSQLLRSPAHLLAYLAQPTDTVALVRGRAIHCAILEPDEFPHRYGHAPAGLDRRRKEDKEIWAQLVDAFGEGLVLKDEEYQMCLHIRDAVHVHSNARKLLTLPGGAEQSVVWVDEETGVTCKARFDKLAPLAFAIGDIKSTEDASRDAFERSVKKYGHYRQGALYLAGAVAHSIDVRHFFNIAVEKTAPYGVVMYELTDGAIDAGQQEVRGLLRTYARCLETNHWPCYPDEIQPAALPSWAWSQIDDATNDANAAEAVTP